MLKLLFAATLTAAQNPSKCLEWDEGQQRAKFDEDCCAIKGTAWCDSNFVLEWSDDVCFKYGDITAHSYSCYDPSWYGGKGNDPFKCWDAERGFDPSCCSKAHQGFCDNGAIAWKWDSVCSSKELALVDWKYNYECLPILGYEEAATRNSAIMYLLMALAALVYQ